MQIMTMQTHGLSTHRLKFNDLEFTDDIDLLEESLARLQESLELVTKETMCYDIKSWYLGTVPQLYHSK